MRPAVIPITHSPRLASQPSPPLPDIAGRASENVEREKSFSEVRDSQCLSTANDPNDQSD